MKLAIIGAGAAGLASARRAIQYNVEITVFEESDRIGGIWEYNENTSNTSSPIYASLRVNLPVQLMEFTGYKFETPDGLCYPFHPDVLKYINDFADHYDLRKFIKFHSRVVKVARVKNKWQVSVQNLGENTSRAFEQYSFDAVMVCNGHYSVPSIPHLPGQETFNGEIIHSRAYRRNISFKDKRLLIVGHGTSGKEISAQCSEVAEVTLTCRCEPWPCEVTLDESRLRVKPRIRYIKNNLVFFLDGSSLEIDVIILCTGKHIFQRAPLVQEIAHVNYLGGSTFQSALEPANGCIYYTGTSNMKQISKGATQDSSEQLLIALTPVRIMEIAPSPHPSNVCLLYTPSFSFYKGYLYDVPFVHESCGVRIREGKIIEPLYKKFINITQPSMSFIGYVGGIFLFALFDLQAEVFIKHLIGCIKLPHQHVMMASLVDEILMKKRNGVPNKSYFMEKNVEEYCASLFYLGNIKAFAPVLWKISYENISRYEQRLHRKYPPKFEVIDDENFICLEEN